MVDTTATTTVTPGSSSTEEKFNAGSGRGAGASNDIGQNGMDTGYSPASGSKLGLEDLYIDPATSPFMPPPGVDLDSGAPNVSGCFVPVVGDLETLLDPTAGLGWKAAAVGSILLDATPVGWIPGTSTGTARAGINAIGDASKLLPSPSSVPNAGGAIRSFVTDQDQTFYRVFSGDATVGGFLTSVPPKSSSWAQEALSLPSWNSADYIQEVLVPAGTRVQRSRALPTVADDIFPIRRGGAEQFELLDRIPIRNFGEGVPFR